MVCITKPYSYIWVLQQSGLVLLPFRMFVWMPRSRRRWYELKSAMKGCL